MVEDSDKCPEAWKGFTSAFEFKDPNNITGDDYEAYFDALPISSPPNSVVFWSGVQGVIEQISKYPNISSSANQDASNIINTMTADDGVECWCGNESAVLDSQSLPYDSNNCLLARVFFSVSSENQLQESPTGWGTVIGKEVHTKAYHSLPTMNSPS